MMDSATLHDGWADALGRTLARERAAWQRERELAVAEHGRQIAEIRAEAAQAILRFSELVSERLATLKDGEPGPPGEPADMQAVSAAHAAWQRERDAMAAEHQAMFGKLDALHNAIHARLEALRDGKNGEPGCPGSPGSPGPPGAPGALPVVRLWAEGVHYLGDVVAHRGSTWQALRDTAREPPDNDWVMLAAAGRDAAEGEVCGQYQPGNAYRKFDLACHDGCEWRARCDDPGPLPGVGWALSAVQGKRGGKGEHGERGLRGEKGDAGEPAATICDWVVEDYRATPLLSDGSLGPPLEMRQFFELYDSELGASR
jgi:hypothetical protein